MKYCYYGVRGSRPVIVDARNLSGIISKLVSTIGIKKLDELMQDAEEKANKVLEEDPYSEISKETLLAEYFNATIYSYNSSYLGLGGNTPCLEVRGDNTPRDQIIVDMGSGLSNFQLKEGTENIHIFISHFHYDHVQGFPFMKELYSNRVKIHFYSNVEVFRDYLSALVEHPFFPVPLERMATGLHFHCIKNLSHVKIGDLDVTWMSLNHPGGCYAYKFTNTKNKSYCYFSDVSITGVLFQHSKENRNFVEGIDRMTLDASMNFEDSVTKRYFGHSNFYAGIDFASFWNVKSIDLFHLDPDSNIYTIPSMYQSAIWYKKIRNSSLDVHIAEENKWIEI